MSFHSSRPAADTKACLIAKAAYLTLFLILAVGFPHIAWSESSESEEVSDTISAKASFTENLYAVPVTDAAAQTTMLQTRLCLPAATATPRLVVINHGSPPDPSDRPGVKLKKCDDEAAQWFLSRGYAVAFVLRRGYGATGGIWAENYGDCSNPAYRDAGLETARDIRAAVEYLTAISAVKHDGVIVVGQSAGGWGTIAYNSLPHPKVAAFIVMAGGRGGHMHGNANSNCRPDRLIEAAGQFGSTSTSPMLWVYTRNDSFFGPTLAEAMYRAVTAAGAKVTFVQPEAYSDDGHHLFFGKGGSLIWGPIVQNFLDGLAL